MGTVDVPCAECLAPIPVSLYELTLESEYFKKNPTEPKKQYYCNLICLNKGRDRQGHGREGKGGRKPYGQAAELGVRPVPTVSNTNTLDALDALEF